MASLSNEPFSLELPDGTIPCTVRLSGRARFLRLRLLPDMTLEVVLPYGTSVAEARRFAESQLGWIVRTRRKMQLRKDQDRTPEKQDDTRLFPDHIDLEYLGGRFSVQYCYTSACWTAAKCTPETRTIRVTGNVLKTGSVRNALIAMLKKAALAYVYPHLEGLASKFEFHPGPCSIRIQKGRWGSCSARGGAISLNAMLLFLPEELVEYILIHELCHLRHMDHSAAFWQEVSKYCPDYRKCRGRIRDLERILPWKFYQN